MILSTMHALSIPGTVKQVFKYYEKYKDTKELGLPQVWT